jgi:hypothetical protein
MLCVVSLCIITLKLSGAQPTPMSNATCIMLAYTIRTPARLMKSMNALLVSLAFGDEAVGEQSDNAHPL